MEPERQWKLLKLKGQEIAVCAVYFRVDSRIHQEYFENNKELKAKIETEMNHLRKKGVKTMIWGDMNGHIGTEKPHGITNNPHQ